MLCRIDLDDPGTVSTLEACSRAVSGLAAHGLMAMVEPFLSRRIDEVVHNDLSTVGGGAVGRDRRRTRHDQRVHLAQAAGGRAAWVRSWRRPRCPPCCSAGTRTAPPEQTYAEWEKALALPGVRGLVVGRTLLYPPDGDVAGAVDTAARLVHPDAPLPGPAAAAVREPGGDPPGDPAGDPTGGLRAVRS